MTDQCSNQVIANVYIIFQLSRCTAIAKNTAKCWGSGQLVSRWLNDSRYWCHQCVWMVNTAGEKWTWLVRFTIYQSIYHLYRSLSWIWPEITDDVMLYYLIEQAKCVKCWIWSTRFGRFECRGGENSKTPRLMFSICQKLKYQPNILLLASRWSQTGFEKPPRPPGESASLSGVFFQSDLFNFCASLHSVSCIVAPAQISNYRPQTTLDLFKLLD